MAVSFSIADLPTLANLAQSHPAPSTFWTWVKANTSSGELTDIANKMIFDWNAAGTTPLAEAKRLADAVQELQGFEHRIELVRQQDTGQGMTVEAQLVETVALV